MKVVLITGSYPNAHCGVGDYTSRLATGLASKGTRVYVLTTDRQEIHALDSGHVKVIKAVPSWSLVHLPRVLRRINEIGPDVVHIQYPTRGYRHHLLVNVYPILHRLFFKGTALVVTIHEFSIAHWLRKISLFFLLWFSNAVIVPDEREKRSLMRWSSRIGSRCRVVPVGANIESVADRQAEASTRLKDPCLVYFGFYSKSKDLYTLLEAFKKIVQGPVKCRLVMIMELSADNQEHRRFSDTLHRLGLDGVVTITGYCSADAVSRYLSDAAICVLPFSDGVSLRRTSFLTALRYGLPTVTTAGKDFPEILKNWENVVLVPIGDSLSMAGAIMKLLTEPDLYKRISDHARRLSERFSWPSIAEEHINLYRAMTKSL